MNPIELDWDALFSTTSRFEWNSNSVLNLTELSERKADLIELEWFLEVIDERVELYRQEYPHRNFEQELASAFRHQSAKLRDKVGALKQSPEHCNFDTYLAAKYEIRTLYKQVGSTLTGSDWQTPSIELSHHVAGAPVELGFIQEEQGTYMRTYGSEYVKAFEDEVMKAFYPMSDACRSQCIRFLTSSGMSALELALVAYKKHTGEQSPCYVQSGFYCEGADLTSALLHHSQELSVERIYEELERGTEIGCLIVDPGVCWPVKSAVDLELLFAKLEGHTQDKPLYIIVDRTLTGVANPLFKRYGDRLPSHVVLISVESGIKYYQYGLDLVNVGFVAAVGAALQEQRIQEQWIALLGQLTAGADPLMVRQLPIPDAERLTARLQRLNRNAYWIESFLRYLKASGVVQAYYSSVKPSEQYQMEGLPWLGSVFYIQLHGEWREADYQAWINELVAGAPDELHLTSGGSFGFDTFRFNTVTDPTGQLNALRMSVGRDPLGQLLVKLHYLYLSLTVGAAER